MNRIILIHNRENNSTAAQIEQQLSRIGIPFEHIGLSADLQPGEIAGFLQASQEPVLLLITDNFLKDTACMADLLPAFQTALRERRVLTVVADGRYSDDGGITYHAVPTHYDRMVNALQYMNYWQNAWLELSDQYAHAQGAEKDALSEQLNITRSIADSMGDFVATLRASDAITLQQLQADDYALFFQKFNLTEWHDPYRQIAQKSQVLPEDSIEQPSDHTSNHLPEHPAEAAPEAILLPVEPEAIPEAAPLESNIPEEPILSPVETPVFSASAMLVDARQPADILQPADSLEEAIEQHIHDARFWMSNGRPEQGLEILQTALEQYPESGKLRQEYEKANAQYHQNTNVPGETEIKSAMPFQPVSEPPVLNTDILSSEARSYELMGDMAYKKNDFLFAKYCWDRTVELAADYPGIYRKLGAMVAEHLPEYRETGMQYLKMALRQNPNDAEAQIAAANMAIQQHEPDAAEVYYRSAIALDSAVQTPENDRKFLPEYAQHTVPVATPEVVAEASEILHSAEQEAPDEETTEQTGDPSQPDTVAAEESTPDMSDTASEMPDVALATSPAEPEMPALQEMMDAEFQDAEIPNIVVLDERAALNPLVVTAEQAPAEPELEDRAEPAASEPETEQEPTATIPAPEALTVLITGATSGIGRAIAELFAKNGHRLIVTGRRVDRLAELKNHFESEWNTPMLMLPFDVRDYGAVRAALEILPENWQNIDILINNAGLAKGFSPVQEGNLEHWETMIDTNLKGLLYVTRVVAPGMVRRRKGHIINIGSIAGQEAYPNGNVYCATKAGVDSLTRAMRMDLYTHNIRVSQVSPGHVEATEFAVNRFDGDADRAAQVYQNFQPLLAADVADVVYYMATRPPHVNIQDVVMFGTQQASATLVDRSGRNL